VKASASSVETAGLRLVVRQAWLLWSVERSPPDVQGPVSSHSVEESMSAVAWPW
jgi:hypothetical protein